MSAEPCPRARTALGSGLARIIGVGLALPAAMIQSQASSTVMTLVVAVVLWTMPHYRRHYEAMRVTL